MHSRDWTHLVCMPGISQMQLRAKAWFKSYKKFELSIQPDAGHQKDSSSVTVLSSSCVQSRKKLIGDELQSKAGTRFQFSERLKKLIGGFCETWFCPCIFKTKHNLLELLRNITDRSLAHFQKTHLDWTFKNLLQQQWRVEQASSKSIPEAR